MIGFDIFKVNDTLTPELDRLVNELENTRPLMAEVGGEMAKTLRGHFRSRGGGFWEEADEATAVTSFDSFQATVGVSPPKGFHVMHKAEGGVVRAKPPRKLLAIPANDMARKAGWPSHWSKIGDGKLKALWGRNGPYALALNQDRIRWSRKSGRKTLATKDDKKGNWGKGVIMYWLKREVRHRADPKALPAPGVMEDAVRRAAERFFNRVLKGGPQA